MGRGRSGAKGGGGTPPKANTPSGISYDQFLQMPEAQRWQTMDNIIRDPNIQVPAYLDGSDTSKVIYALGMDNRPTVVSDSQLDAMTGREVFRTIYEQGAMPPPSTQDIADQIRNSPYTQLSGKGGSAHSRALYLATNFQDSAMYGDKNYNWGGSPKKNVMIVRGKLNPNAKIVSEQNLTAQMTNKGFTSITQDRHDRLSLYAISQGVDGWYSGSYTMLVSRKNVTMSDQNRRISKRNTKGEASTTAARWQDAAIAR